MRLLHLTMEAFGPFIERTEIDFELLGKNGLYLITGETGAGKTTIFDAIMFALFGGASGEDRTASMFRSKYADETRETFVSLDFMYQGKKYTVKRKPGDYQIKKIRGEGTKKAELYAELSFDDERRTITGAEKVSVEINQILGVNQRQFKQIAMIAQGEFRKLLTVKTEERKLMLRNIFGTGNYDLVIQKLKERKTEAEETYYQLQDAIKQERERVQVVEESIYASKIHEEQGKEEVENIDAFTELLEAYIQEEQNTKQSLLTQEQHHIEQLNAMHQRKTIASHYIDVQNQITQANTKLVKLNQEMKEKEEQYRKAGEAGKQIPILHQRVGKLENQLPEYQKVTALQKQNEIDTKDKQVKQTQLFSKQKEEQQIIQQIEQNTLFIKENESCEAEYHTLSEKKEKLVQEETGQEQLLSQLQKYLNQEKKLHDLQATYLSHQSSYQAQKKQYDALETAYYDGQASILARKLEDNKPCPVCGSIHHDATFVHDLLNQVDQSITKEKLDVEAEKTEELRQKMIDTSTLVASHKGYLDEQYTQIQQLKQITVITVQEVDTVKEKIHQLLQWKKEIQDQINQSEKIVKAYRQAITHSPTLQSKFNEKKTECIQLQQDIQRLDQAIQNSNVQIQEIQNHLEYESEAQLKDFIQSLQKEASVLEKNINIAQQEKTSVQQQITGVTSNLEQWQKELDGKTIEDIQTLESQIQKIQDASALLSKEKDAYTSRITVNQNAMMHLKKYVKQTEEAEQKVLPIRELYRTYNGELKDRIKLESYILSEHFDRILYQANRRLYEMSDGQYELLRKEDVDDKRKKEGLEIEIWDYNTNSARNVATLSGGESFMASLALALGLSDEVQQSSGGIHFESMFIDEGFGSLDEYALSKAITVLSKLSSHDCLIGIISHVSELKERIEHQIVVKKDPRNGSVIELKA